MSYVTPPTLGARAVAGRLQRLETEANGTRMVDLANMRMEDLAKCGLVRPPKVSPSDVNSDVSPSGITSGTPSADEYDLHTLTQIRDEKHKRWGELFEPEETDDGEGPMAQ